LAQLYASHHGKVSDKWSSYLREYDRVFAEYRDRPVRVLEIGVQNGGSLELWSAYFRKARAIVGCDIDRAVADLTYDDPRIAVVAGDANAPTAEAAILSNAPAFDIIIDDGSHLSSDVVKSFARYFPHLADRGVYIVEDLHCSYWQRFGGGLYHPFSSMTFFKRLADAINYDHWGVSKSRAEILSGFRQQYDVDVSEEALQAVHSVEFTNSLAFVRKERASRNRLKQRVIAGSVATVAPESIEADSRRTPTADESDNAWTARSIAPDEELAYREREFAEREERIAALDSLIADRDRQLNALQQTIEERDKLMVTLNEVASEQQTRIDNLNQTAAKWETEVQRLEAQLVEDRHNAHRELAERDRRIRALETHLTVMYTSRSWRITAPLRAAFQRLRWLGHMARRALRPASWIATGQFRRAVTAVLPYYRRYVPPGVKEMLPDKLRIVVKRPFEAEGLTLPQYAQSSLNQAVLEAQAASRATNWPEALRIWESVLQRYGGDDGVAARARLNISVARRLRDLDAYRNQVMEYTLARAKRISLSPDHPRIVVYTAISGAYDSMKLPAMLDARFDYLLFTDTPTPSTGVWQVRPITYHHEDITRTARFVKTHPHMLLADYDVAIWIDANIMILGDISPLVDRFLNSGDAVGAIPHPLRRTVHEELEACIRLKKDDPETMQEQIGRYRSMGFDHDDLIESSLMIFNIRDDRLKPFLDTWWREIDRYSKRDQLSLNFALREAGLDWVPLMAYPNSVRNHPLLAYVAHDDGTGPARLLLDGLHPPVIDPYAGPAYADVRKERLDAHGHRRIDIVVCVHNALDDVKVCLDSIRRARTSEQQRLIIIDDGSDASTARYLRAFADQSPWVDVYRNDQARGYTSAANRGLALSTAELVILLNSDTVVTDAWADKLADAVFSTSGAGIVGPMSNAASHQSIPEHHGTTYQTAINELPPGLTAEDVNRHCEEWTTIDVLPRVPLVHGFCLGITREAIESVGIFDERHFPKGYGEENDYCFRATDAGFGLVIATHTYVFHAKSRSYIESKRVRLMRQGAEALRTLHGSKRVDRAVRSMQGNSLLQHMRDQARSLTAPADAIADRRRAAPRLKRCLAIIPLQPNGSPEGTGYIRVLRPLQHRTLSRIVSLSLAATDRLNISPDHDAVLVQRDAVRSPTMVKDLIAMCQARKARLIYEIDDDLIHLPETHPSSARFSPVVREAMQTLAEHADFVIVSTEALKTRMSVFNQNVLLIPNALDEQLWRRPSLAERPSRNHNEVRLLYMGTRTHDEDLELIMDDMRRLNDKYGDQVTFTAIGGFAGNPPETVRVERVPASAGTYPEFAKWMSQSCQFDIALAPLVDSEFNRYKSYIKFLDYGICGFAPVLSDVLAYREVVKAGETGVLVASAPGQWFHALCLLIDDPALRHELAQNARDDVLAHHTLGAQAAERQRIWTEILS
jgi:GT2 family glycosyltransferase/glycosyltransferase involved in cell wall biosynthesis